MLRATSLLVLLVVGIVAVTASEETDELRERRSPLKFKDIMGKIGGGLGKIGSKIFGAGVSANFEKDGSRIAGGVRVGA